MKHSPTQPLTKIISYILKRIAIIISRASEMKARAKEALPINLHSKKYIRILQMLKTQLKRNWKGNPLFYYFLLCFSFMTGIIFLSFIPFEHDYVILLHLYTLLLPNNPWSLNWLSFTPNIV